MRYLQVGGTRQRHFDGTNLEPRKLSENAQTPTSRVHAVLGSDPSSHFGRLLMYLEGLYTSFKYAQFLFVFIFVWYIKYTPCNTSIKNNVLNLPKL